MRKFWVALVLASALMGPLVPQSAEARPPTPVEVRAKQIQRQRGGWVSCSDGSCFVTARDGSWMVTIRSFRGVVYVTEQKKK
ncbi:hypothetical protein Rctr71_055 [Virus Rctr71]|nr:hypothetical protein Rctr71_055 [Virus Rctr71]